MVLFEAAIFYTILIFKTMLPVLIIILLLAPSRNRWLLIAMGIHYFIYIVCLFAPRFGIFQQFWHNWQGPLLAIALITVLVMVVPRLSFPDIGISRRLANPAWRPFIFAVTVSLVLAILAKIIAKNFFTLREQSLNIETLVFYLIIPGISEEVVFRGFYQSLLNKVFAKDFLLFGANIGMAWILTALLFTVGHVFTMDMFLNLNKNYYAYATILPLALILGWLRERYDSLFPGMLVHNAVNFFGVITSYLLLR